MNTRWIHHRPIVALASLLLLTVLGCAKQSATPSSEDNPETPSPVAIRPVGEDAPPNHPTSGNDESGSGSKSFSGDPSNVCAIAETDVVPGTSFVAPTDDALADGWQTESLSSAAVSALKELAAHLPGSHKEPKKAVADYVAKDIEFSALHPEVTTVFEDTAFTVAQAADPETANKKNSTGAAEFQSQLQAMLGFVSNPHDVHAKVKIVRVEHAERKLTTSALMQIWGDSDEGAFQSDATWDCEWTIADESGSSKIELASLGIRDYVEVTGKKAAGGGPMFADCTVATLGKNESFREQLLPSIDRWLHTLEIQFHLDIGGWEGISIADVNGDGLEDVYISQPGGLPNRLFLHLPDGTCKDVSAESKTDWLNQTHGSVFADMDNDGDQDLIVGVHDGIIVMANDGNGVFTVRAGQILPAAVPYSITVADYDVDGDNDIFVCCYDKRWGVNRQQIFAKAIPYHDANNGGRNVLFRNESSEPDANRWLFRYVTSDVGLDQNNRRFSYAAAWEDYDNDGDLDLYIANDFGRNNLFRNDDGHFEDVAAEAGVEDISAGMSITWSDYNNDGWMDIYVSNMFSSAGNRIAFQRKFKSDAEGSTKSLFQRHARGNTLFENQKDGTFKDVSVDANVTMGRWAWGSRFFDLNNDGWKDILVGNGFLTQPKSGDL